MKRKRLLGGGVALATIAAAATIAATALGGSNAGTILIGISAAKTGILAPYDLQPGQAFMMRIDETKITELSRARCGSAACVSA